MPYEVCSPTVPSYLPSWVIMTNIESPSSLMFLSLHVYVPVSLSRTFSLVRSDTLWPELGFWSTESPKRPGSRAIRVPFTNHESSELVSPLHLRVKDSPWLTCTDAPEGEVISTGTECKIGERTRLKRRTPRYNNLNILSSKINIMFSKKNYRNLRIYFK